MALRAIGLKMSCHLWLAIKKGHIPKTRFQVLRRGQCKLISFQTGIQKSLADQRRYLQKGLGISKLLNWNVFRLRKRGISTLGLRLILLFRTLSEHSSGWSLISQGVDYCRGLLFTPPLYALMIFPGYTARLGQDYSQPFPCPYPPPNQISYHSLGTLFMVNNDKLSEKVYFVNSEKQQWESTFHLNFQAWIDTMIVIYFGCPREEEETCYSWEFLSCIHSFIHSLPWLLVPPDQMVDVVLVYLYLCPEHE